MIMDTTDTDDAWSWTPAKIDARVMELANSDGFEYTGARMVKCAHDGKRDVWVIGLVEVTSRSRLPRENCLAPKGPDGKYPMHHPERSHLVLTIVYIRGRAMSCSLRASVADFYEETARWCRLRLSAEAHHAKQLAARAQAPARLCCPTCGR